MSSSLSSNSFMIPTDPHDDTIEYSTKRWMKHEARVDYMTADRHAQSGTSMHRTQAQDDCGVFKDVCVAHVRVLHELVYVHRYACGDTAV